MTDLSLCILTQNHREMLRDCLRSVYKTTQTTSLEVFVVDNGSTDGTLEMVPADFPQVKLIRNERFPGFPAANNQALRQSSGRYAMILNDDIVMQPEALDRLVAFMDEHPKVGAVGPALLNPDGSYQRSSYQDYLSLKTAFLTWVFPFSAWWRYRSRSVPAGADAQDSYGVYNGDYTSTRQVKHLMGAAILVRAEVLRTVGLLDEGIFIAFEDQDWCKRIDEAGWPVFYLPSSRITHLGGQTVGGWSNFRQTNLESRVYFHRKHYGRLSAAALKAIIMQATVINLAWCAFRNVGEKSVARKDERNTIIAQHRRVLRWLFGRPVDSRT